jgi:hypothetical protein
MDRPVMFPAVLPVNGAKSPASPPKAPQDGLIFNTVLNDSISTRSPGGKEVERVENEPILVGRISQNQPTVSQLLLDNENLADKGWDIIFSKSNRNKPYTRITPGTPVYYSPESGELSWPGLNTTGIKDTQAIHVAAKPVPNKIDSPLNNTIRTKELAQPAGEKRTENQLIGTLSTENPTVSHLLHANQNYRDRTWGLLAEAVNKDKSFNQIPSGTKIYLNTATDEISWKKVATAVQTVQSNRVTPPEHSERTPGPPMDLTEAVQPYIGKPYKEVNCYGLLVKGLKNLGVPYTGKDGLRDRLTSMAKEQGLPSNAFLNGEGIVKAAGSEVLSQSYLRINDWSRDAGKSFEEMAQVLEKGQILSFSTPTKGHTGIISKHNEEWTFINSGRMDNHVASPNTPKEVGEENLMEEIRNWFKVANKSKESLVVTLGQLEGDKIRNTMKPDFQLTQRL